MGETAHGTRRGFWRRLGRGLRNGWELMWFLEFLGFVVRLILVPFRMLGRALSDL
ncbi:hypothetical protein J4G33_14040 [Actinotalea sp. BY-33]|uniref:Uncharacterized protein n=1 Tax=Actinotalea soli TaxID=2819234 RepID=A0A939LVK2_9CELL|nr:hypothetical protein [Actinotalea soli]MBO1752929.1 hypothetical protein [Actinotalea soli]